MPSVYKPVDHKKRRCQVCRQWFKPQRLDAKFCGNNCRQAAHRERHRTE